LLSAAALVHHRDAPSRAAAPRVADARDAASTAGDSGFRAGADARRPRLQAVAAAVRAPQTISDPAADSGSIRGDGIQAGTHSEALKSFATVGSRFKVQGSRFRTMNAEP